MSLPTVSLLSKAIEHHQRGELEQADQLYREILAKHPNHADALHLLGVVTLQRGQVKQAIELIERAITLHPSEAVFHGNLGEAYRTGGQLKRAAACYQVALRLKPDSPDVAINYGLLLMRAGRPAQAAALFRKAIEHQPNAAQAHNGLGNACRSLGDIEQALTHFRRAVELEPQLAAAQTNLGQLLLDIGRASEALPHCREAVRLRPEFGPVHNNLGNVLRKLGEMTEARASYTTALRLAPNMAVVCDNLGKVMQHETKYDEAVRWFEQALQIEPKNLLYRTHLAAALIERGDHAAAEEQLRGILESHPDYPEAHLVMGKLRAEQGRLEESQAEYRGLLQKEPNNPAVNQILGEMLLELNQQEQALSCFRAALRGNPRFIPAHSQLATHLRGKLSAEEQQALRRLAAEPDLPAPERATLYFAMAQVCDAQGLFEEAAQHLERANALELKVRRERGLHYNPDAHVTFIDRMISVCNATFFDRVQGFGVDSARPLFIVGLPRSGTTLLEQILASHSRVFGAGELTLARKTFEALGHGANAIHEERALDVLETIDADRARELANGHLEKLNALNSTADHITDKMPDNYMYLGMLAVLFPKARFIHCRRDLRDVAVSCWITQFRSIPWANDVGNLASRFAQYQKIMEHWRHVLPMPLLDVEYEDTVEDLESVARRVLDFCGLEWEPACLEFHRTRRPIRTASLTQVRQPIYRRSLARWRHYQSALQPLFARLGFVAEAAASSQHENESAEVGAV